MNGLERIHQQILQEATLEANALRDLAEEKRKAALNLAETKANDRYQASLAEMKDKQQRLRAQLKAKLRMNERGQILANKQAWIQKVLQAALQRLVERSASEKLADYSVILTQPTVLAEIKAQPDAKVIIDLTKGDNELKDSLLASLPADLATKCLVRADRCDFTAGLIINIGLVHFNYSYEEELRRREADFIGLVGNLLFKRKD